MESSHGISLLIGTLLFLVFTAATTIMPGKLGKLGKLPGPRLHKITSIPYLVHMIRGAADVYTDKLHRIYGPIVQVAPDQISVNDVAGLRDVFAVSRRLDRPEALPFFHNYGAENLVSTVNGDVHQDRRRPLRNIFSAKVAQSVALNEVISEATAGMVALAKEKATAAVEIKPLLQLALYDIMSFVAYGPAHKLNLVRDAGQRKAMQVDIDFQEKRQLSVATGFMFLLPNATLWLRRWGLAPKSINGHFHLDLVSDRLGREALAALQASDEGTSTDGYERLMQRLYAHWQENGGPSPAVPSIEYILSDSLDNFWAGVSTTSDGLTPLFRYLSLPENQDRQARLREEILQAVVDTGVSSSFALSADQLKQMPFLEAVIKETLRLHPPIPFSMERLVTKREAPVSVHGYPIPAGWKISSQATYMQRAEKVFDDSLEWHPERWLNGARESREEMKDRKAHFLAFGAGPRMCLGMNIAWSAMRGIVAGVYGSSSTAISEQEKPRAEKSTQSQDKKVEGVVQAWIAERSRKTWLRFEDIQES
jgi:cytochrome P450